MIVGYYPVIFLPTRKSHAIIQESVSQKPPRTVIRGYLWLRKVSPSCAFSRHLPSFLLHLYYDLVNDSALINLAVSCEQTRWPFYRLMRPSGIDVSIVQPVYNECMKVIITKQYDHRRSTM